MNRWMPSTVPRREFLRTAGGGIGSLALATLLHGSGTHAATTATPSGHRPYAPKSSHFPAKAKRVIWLFMHGGPSHVDLFDPKPDLIKYAGQPLPESFGTVMTRRKVAKNPLLGPVQAVPPRGESGLEISDFLPHIAELADELCVIRSCHGDSVNHPQSVYQMNTGSILMGQPSVGSWVSYGLGTENRRHAGLRRPARSRRRRERRPAGLGQRLSARDAIKARPMRPGTSPILHLRPQPGMSARAAARDARPGRSSSIREHLAARDADDELAARIAAYELAFRMQSAAPDLVDTRGETAETLQAVRHSTRKRPTSSARAACSPGG